MADNSLYQAFGLTRDATVEDIRKAYRLTALREHPDRISDPALRAAATEKLAKLNGYYKVPNTKRYDDFLLIFQFRSCLIQ